ncbi:MAG TPA: Ig-like domain-containing protein, partial [Allosphingosinicella sp.]|nr:Ig-like domain-containing protein [Allosphingosinicella sp.]
MPGYPSLLDLSSLGDFGFVLRGQNPGDEAGISVASAGDINNDGFDDFIIGARNAGSNEQGVAYVVFGKAAAFGTTFLFPTLAPPDGFLIEGEANNDDAGNSVASAGDVNNDGYDDIIIGAERNGVGDPGAAYVIFGKASGFGSISLASLAIADGYKITGASGFFGHSVASAGDINNDGYDDIIIGESQGASTKGVSYVIFGKASGFANLSAATLTPADGFKITGATTGDGAGVRVSSAGDVNNDGYDDILIGANSHDSGASGAGAAYVLFGKAAGFTNINLASLSAADGFRIDGENQNDNLGIAASSAGDFNNDGFDDILLGANFFNGGGTSDSGGAYLIFGKASGFSNIDLQTLAPADGFRIPGFFRFDNVGADVRAAGDINGDGFGDLLVSAPGTDAFGNDAGVTYVLFGHASNFGTVDLTMLAASEDFRIQGDNAGDLLGLAVNAAGDINNDGYDDIIVSAPGAGASGEGRAYVIYGRSTAGTPAVDNGATDTRFATSYTEDQAPVPIVAGGAVVTSSDPINSMTITGSTGGTLTLAGAPPPGISASGVGTSTIIFSGSASNADYASALSMVRFAVAGDNPTSYGTVTSRTVSITIDAGLGAQVAGYTTIAITGIDDPAVARNDSFALAENVSALNASVFTNNGQGADFDPDTQGAGALTVTQVNGSAGNVGNSFFLPSGAILRVNADGTFAYEPNHAFDSTPAPGSGATNQPASDSFTYTLAGGSTATVTLSITGVDSADFLVGPAGPNTLAGGNGNDTYLLDDPNDLVIETAAGGARDVVYVPFSYTLGQGVYVEVLSTSSQAGTAPLVLVGNELGQEILGNA